MAQLVVTAVTSHRCGMCLTPVSGVIVLMQVESVVVFVFASKVPFGFSCFLLSRKCDTSELV